MLRAISGLLVYRFTPTQHFKTIIKQVYSFDAQGKGLYIYSHTISKKRCLDYWFTDLQLYYFVFIYKFKVSFSLCLTYKEKNINCLE